MQAKPGSATPIRAIGFLMIVLICVPAGAMAREYHTRRSQGSAVFYDGSLDVPARDLASVVPAIRTRLETTFDWQFHRNPEVLLIGERENFLKMTDNPLNVAFASPARNLIVIDHSQMSVHPFTMVSTLEHEMCHILLHQHVDSIRLPRWLDEGLCQWASNSIDEIIHGQRTSALRGVVLSERMVPLADLQHRFPDDRTDRLLAYEASKRFTTFLLERHGKPRVLAFLKRLEDGDDVPAAASLAFSSSLEDLEQRWRATLTRKTAWLTFLGHYLYEILFALMAVMTVYGFIRSRVRQRRYRDEDEDEDPVGAYGE